MSERRKLAYICSPYNAATRREKKRNIDYAQKLTKAAIKAGFAPITPHLYITQCLDDEDVKQRGLGMDAAQALLKACDCIMVGARYGISAGMEIEIALAMHWNKQVIQDER